MATFKFYQDVKFTEWGRNHFEVEADTEEEAIAIVKSHLDEDISEVDDERVSFIDWNLLDVMENLTPSENGGQPTKEFYDSSRKLVGTNCDKE